MVRVRYFVDGYNVIRSADAFAGGTLRDQRERLLRFIEDKRPQGAAGNRVTVVFDGRADVSSPAWGGATQVVFSHGRDADAVIKERVDDLANPAEAMVVTNDRAIQRWVRQAGARILSCAVFIAAGGNRPTPGRPAGSLLPSQKDAINEELARLWKLK